MSPVFVARRSWLDFTQRALPALSVAIFLIFSTNSSSIRAQTKGVEAQPASSPSPDAARIDQLFNECRQLMSRGAYDEMTTKAYEALALSRNIGDQLRQARSMNYVGIGKFHSGHIEEAIEPFKQAGALAGEAGDIRLQFLALNSGGVLLEGSGRYEEALYFYNLALAVCRTQADRRCEPGLLRNVGSIHWRTGNGETARRVLQRSLEMAREFKLDAMVYAALIMLGSVELESGDARAARSWEEQALKLELPGTPIAAKFDLRNQIAIAHQQLGEFEQAAASWSEALGMARSQKVPSAEAIVLGNLARLKLQLGKTADTLELTTQALGLLRRIGGDPLHRSTILYTHARAQRGLGKPEEALSSLREAMVLIERSRPLALPTEASKAVQFSKSGIVFLEAVELLARLGHTEEALAVSEAYHGRAFLDSLVEARADMRRVLPKEVLNREEAILDRMSGIQRQLWLEGLAPEREAQLKKDLAATEDSLEAFQVEVRRANPGYAGLKYLQPFNAQRIQRELLDSDTALLEYAVGNAQSFVWLVTRNKVSFAVLPKADELKRLVAEYRNALAEKSTSPDSSRSLATVRLRSRQLYQILLSPFAAQLSSARRLIVVPDAALSYLPFETLISNQSGRSRYLVEQFNISYAPSASALAAIRTTQSRGGSKGFIAFGDPVYPDKTAAGEPLSESRSYFTERGLDLRRLPYSRKEVTNIGDFFPVGERRLFLGADANETKVKTEKLDGFRYVHFATHGIVDEQNPSRSGVVLSLGGNEKEDGMLQVTEIMRLKLNADLVTLSACRTGLGKVVHGEGVLGLTRAFHYAGANSVVVSLWNVNDIATAELMREFYANLKRGLAKDEALRQAKLGLLKGNHRPWQHPYFWASFVLVGANN